MLIIHIGSPKTGTTALQGFLKTNGSALKARGISFVSAGRTNIAHNSMVKPILRGRGADVISAVRDEISAAPGLTHVMSSEVFFQPAMAPLLADGLIDAAGDVRIFAYLRRPDLYAEAMYKQKVKNGRIAPDPGAFLEKFAPNLRYSAVLHAYRDAFGVEALRVRPFERRHFPEGDVIADFIGALDGGDLNGLTRPATPSNKTLSRAVSEHLGLVARHTEFNTRALIRDIAARAAPGTLRSGDVFDKATRRRIMAEIEADLAEVCEAYLVDLDQPFDLDDLRPDAEDAFPGTEEMVTLERAASEAVMAALGRLSGRKAQDV